MPLEEESRARRIYIDGFRNRLAHVQCVKQRHFRNIFANKVRKIKKNFFALTRRFSRPTTILKRSSSGLHRSIDIMTVSSRDITQLFACSWVEILEGLTTFRANKLTINPALTSKIYVISLGGIIFKALHFRHLSSNFIHRPARHKMVHQLDSKRALHSLSLEVYKPPTP